jgi:hypothetical protein
MKVLWFCWVQIIGHFRQLTVYWYQFCFHKMLFIPTVINGHFVVLLKMRFGWCMVINSTFNNIWVITWWSVLLVEETGGPGENHWQTLSQNVVSSTHYHHIQDNHFWLPLKTYFINHLLSIISENLVLHDLTLSHHQQ